jgi:hypothetical protein
LPRKIYIPNAYISIPYLISGGTCRVEGEV